MTSVESGLEGRVAVVTGGGAGIGQGIALGLAQAGADVLVADIDADRAEATARRVADLGRHSAATATDVRDTAQVQAMVDAAAERLGRVDVLVNNAGGVRKAAFLSQSERSWRRHIDMNLVSVLAGVAAAAPVMIAQGDGGSILNVVSIEASRAAPDYAVYAACKAAVVNFTRTMALELAGDGIRVNAVSPGTIATYFHEIYSTPEKLEATRQKIPLQRLGTAEDCAGAFLYLASPRLGGYVTGQVIEVNGGQLMP
jgi:NAD(P)-dependent dehydrogenase (short-subunit alcohol dehydrogenase family)